MALSNITCISIPCAPYHSIVKWNICREMWLKLFSFLLPLNRTKITSCSCFIPCFKLLKNIFMTVKKSREICCSCFEEYTALDKWQANKHATCSSNLYDNTNIYKNIPKCSVKQGLPQHFHLTFCDLLKSFNFHISPDL